MPANSTIHVRGLRDMQRAFAKADKTLSRELRDTLREAAEPVRSDAEQMAQTRIPRIGPDWSGMRVGVTRKLVYVAPRQRGVKSRGNRLRRRPNLADLLMERSMTPALNDNIGEVEQRVDDLLRKVGSDWERA